MLIALFALLFLGGNTSPLLGHIEMLHDNVKAEVQSEDRRAQAADILKDIEENTKDFGKRQVDRAKDFGQLNEFRELDTKAADDVWAAIIDDVESYHAQILSARQDLKAVVTRDEWQRVFATDAAD